MRRANGTESPGMLMTLLIGGSPHLHLGQASMDMTLTQIARGGANKLFPYMFTYLEIFALREDELVSDISEQRCEEQTLRLHFNEHLCEEQTLRLNFW